MTKSQRYADKLVNGRWILIKFHEIKEGDIFRIFEKNGDPVYSIEGDTVFEAASDAFYFAEENTYAVRYKGLMREWKIERSWDE